MERVSPLPGARPHSHPESERAASTDEDADGGDALPPISKNSSSQLRPYRVPSRLRGTSTRRARDRCAGGSAGEISPSLAQTYSVDPKTTMYISNKPAQEVSRLGGSVIVMPGHLHEVAVAPGGNSDPTKSMPRNEAERCGMSAVSTRRAGSEGGVPITTHPRLQFGTRHAVRRLMMFLELPPSWEGEVTGALNEAKGDARVASAALVAKIEQANGAPSLRGSQRTESLSDKQVEELQKIITRLDRPQEFTKAQTLLSEFPMRSVQEVEGALRLTDGDVAQARLYLRQVCARQRSASFQNFEGLIAAVPTKLNGFIQREQTSNACHSSVVGITQPHDIVITTTIKSESRPTVASDVTHSIAEATYSPPVPLNSGARRWYGGEHRVHRVITGCGSAVESRTSSMTTSVISLTAPTSAPTCMSASDTSVCLMGVASASVSPSSVSTSGLSPEHRSQGRQQQAQSQGHQQQSQSQVHQQQSQDHQQQAQAQGHQRQAQGHQQQPQGHQQQSQGHQQQAQPQGHQRQAQGHQQQAQAQGHQQQAQAQGHQQQAQAQGHQQQAQAQGRQQQSQSQDHQQQAQAQGHQRQSQGHQQQPQGHQQQPQGHQQQAQPQGHQQQAQPQGHQQQPQGHQQQAQPQGHRRQAQGHQQQAQAQGHQQQSQGHQQQAQPQGHQQQPQGHQLQAQPQGHQRQPQDHQQQPQGHQQQAQPQGHQQQPQGHQLQAQPQGHQQQAQPQGHQLQAQPQGHQLQAQPQGHQLQAQSQGHQLQAQPQGHQLQAQPQGHQLQAQPQGHQLQAQPQGHQLQAQPQGHQLQAQSQGHQQQAQPQPPPQTQCQQQECTPPRQLVRPHSFHIRYTPTTPPPMDPSAVSRARRLRVVTLNGNSAEEDDDSSLFFPDSVAVTDPVCNHRQEVRNTVEGVDTAGGRMNGQQGSQAPVSSSLAAVSSSAVSEAPPPPPQPARAPPPPAPPPAPTPPGPTTTTPRVPTAPAARAPPPAPPPPVRPKTQVGKVGPATPSLTRHIPIEAIRNVGPNSAFKGDGSSIVLPEEYRKELINEFKRTEVKPPSEKTQEEQKQTILDPYRERNVGIVLLCLRLPIQTIETAVRAFDELTLGEEHISSLMKIIPTMEDIQGINFWLKQNPNAKTAQLHQLSIPVRFFMMTMKVDHYWEKLQCWNLRNEFKGRIDDLSEKLRIAMDGVTAALEAPHLPRMLQFILALSNFLNSGSRYQEAKGFPISQLPQIIDFRTTDSRRVLLEHLVEIIEQQDRDVHHCIEELLPVVDSASKIDVPGVSGEVKSLRARLQRCATLVRAIPDDKPWSTKLGRFIYDALPTLEHAERLVEELNTKIEKMPDFFCEKPESFSMNDTLRCLSNFAKKYDAKRTQLQERAARCARTADCKKNKEEGANGSPHASTLLGVRKSVPTKDTVGNGLQANGHGPVGAKTGGALSARAVVG